MYEEIHCVTCNDNNFKFLYCGFDRRHKIRDEFHIIECKNCGTHTLWPRLTQDRLKKYYPDGYDVYFPAIEDEKSILKKYDRYRHRNKFCRQVIKRTKFNQGKILDIGCATGIFLDGMKKFGWDCYGVEPSEYAADYARKKFNLNVVTDYIENVNFQNQYFDVITLWDVLEHTIDPNEVLSKVYSLLKPEGLILLTLPNSRSWEHYIFGTYWAGWDIPRHYNIFSPKTISKLLEQNGLSTDEIFGFTGRHGFFMLCIEFWMNDLNIKQVYKHIIHGIFNSIFARTFFYPFYILSEKLLLSSTIAVSASKSNIH